MKNIKLNSVYEIETNEGDKIKLTLAYKYLYKLRSTNKAAYDDYNNIMMKGPKDEFDNITIIYTAYLCSLLEDNGTTEGAMSYDDFLDVLPFDRVEITRAVGMLIAPKKTMASKALS